ncbi:MAG: UDP-N-acetylmuramoyl-tripeptide--D-alanyl-D-alanine ligase [Aquificaceae bacterium]
MTTLELAELLRAQHSGKPLPFSGFSIDSRSVQKGQVFVAIRGKTHDGHDFALDALKRGAVGVICERRLELPTGAPQILVENSLEALRSFARWRRENFRGKVIAIAGSAGKTTTKELTAYLLSKVGKVCRTPRNYNSQVGVPLSVANFEEGCHFWVVEIGASQKGDVRRLVELVRPHIRAITAIGEEHLETFGCLDDVVLGNGEVFHQMEEEDWGVCPSSVSHCYSIHKKLVFGEGEFRAENINLSEEGISFRVYGVDVFIPVPSLALIENSLCAFAILRTLDIDWKDLVHYLADFHPVEGRFRILRKGKVVLVDDTYNANPPSVRMALKSLSLFRTRRIAVLGDMLELGKDSEHYHRETGRLCAELGIDVCLFLGEHMKHAYELCKELGGRCYHFKAPEELLDWLLRNVSGKAVILFKGSRGMNMERLVEGFLNGRAD